MIKVNSKSLNKRRKVNIKSKFQVCKCIVIEGIVNDILPTIHFIDLDISIENELTILDKLHDQTFLLDFNSIILDIDEDIENEDNKDDTFKKQVYIGKIIYRIASNDPEFFPGLPLLELVEVI